MVPEDGEVAKVRVRLPDGSLDPSAITPDACGLVRLGATRSAAVVECERLRELELYKLALRVPRSAGESTSMDARGGGERFIEGVSANSSVSMLAIAPRWAPERS